LKAGETVELHFPMAGLRFRTEVSYQGRGRYMESTFHLPRAIQFAERRRSRRTRLGAREKASVAVFESIAEGVAASGRLLNLSMEGLCLRLDRAMQVLGGKRIAPHPGLFTEGRQLQIVRLLNLPQLPPLECTGVVRFCSAPRPGGPVLLGLQLEGLNGLDTEHLNLFLRRRLPTHAQGFPARRRRGDLEEDNPEGDGEEDLLAEDGPEDEVPEASVPEEVEEPGEAPIAGVGPEDSDDLPAGNDQMLRLRRRGKRLLVIMPDELERSMFVCTLHVCGFTGFLEARNLVQGLDQSKRFRVDAIFVDQQVGPLTGTEVAQRLRKMGRLDGVPIFQFQRLPDVRRFLAAKAAGVTHVVKHPVDFDGELKGLLDQALGL
jgi:CheY-like chemotaxis protein